MNRVLAGLVFLTAATCFDALAIEYKEVPLKNGNITLNIESSPQCTWGDMDILGLELREHLQKQIQTTVLVSIESFDGKISTSSEPNIERFFKGEDRSLQPVTLALPAVQYPTLVGVYVCKDSSGGKSCYDKNLEDYKVISSRHFLEMKDGHPVTGIAPDQIDPTKAAKDSIYYYQPAILTSTALKIISEDFSADSLKAFQAEVVRSNWGDSSSIEHVENAINLLKSGALIVSKGEVTIDMPSSDQSRCAADVNQKRQGSIKLPENQKMYDNSIAALNDKVAE